MATRPANISLTLLSAMVLIAWPQAGRATETELESQSPYWEAGPRDKRLSNACSLGRFNERQIGRYVIRLHPKAGGGAVLGIAKGNGLNLWDPGHLAVPTEDYLFRQDGTSACEVFVGGRGNQAPKPPAAPAPQQTVPGASPRNGPPT